jgi:uncharacterized protein with HEPN domain
LPSEKPAQRLEDIIENAQAIWRYIAGMALAAFEEGHKTYDAVDEDLTVAGLLAGRRSGESPQSLRKWLDSRKRNKLVPPPPRKPARV